MREIPFREKTADDDNYMLNSFGDVDLNSTEDECFKFIFGILSGDCISTDKPSLYSMNDLEILLDKETNEYILGLEEIYQFNSIVDKINYYESLEKPFREYLISVGEKEENLTHPECCNSFSKYYCTEVLKDISSLKSTSLLDLYWKYVLWLRMLNIVYMERTD